MNVTIWHRATDGCAPYPEVITDIAGAEVDYPDTTLYVWYSSDPIRTCWALKPTDYCVFWGPRRRSGDGVR